MTNFLNNNDNTPLKIITLSGTENVTKNLTVYEYGNDIILVDCGIGFPDSEMMGVDVVIPDMTYLEENFDKVKALILTHGHEDHIGAVPYFLQKFPDVPIYSSKLVQGFLREKLSDPQNSKAAKNVRFNLLVPGDEAAVIGSFKVEAFRVNHSVPSSTGIAIHTPQGLVLHMADYKVDWTPVLDKPMDVSRIARYGDSGVLCLLSDCLGATTEGYSKSESTLNETFNEFFDESEDRQIYVTTISSNISRMYQIISSALKHNRKVVLAGRSIRQTVAVGRSLGYLPFDNDIFVEEEDSARHLQKDLVYIIAGCYGQSGSGLERLSRGEHKNLFLEENALVVFSADPSPPGVVEDVERVMSDLTLQGAEVIYSQIQENLHVSGHGIKGDLTLIAELARPKYFIPIGGTITKMRAYTNMIDSLGFERDSVFEQLEGESVHFRNGTAEKGPTIETKQVYIDGSTIGDIGPTVIKDREQLSNDGVFVAVVPISKETNEVMGKVETITRGFVYVKSSKTLIGQAKDVVNKTLDKNQGSVGDWGALKNKLTRDLEKFLYKETKRKPVIIVQAIYV